MPEETNVEAEETVPEEAAKTQAEEPKGEKEPAEPKKKPNIKVIVTAVVIALAAIGGGAYWYVNYQVPHQKAVDAFNQAVAGLDERNVKLDAAIADLQDLQGSDDKPLDTAVDEAASSAIGQAQAAKQSAPEMPDSTDEINASAKKIDGMGEYQEQLDALTTAKQNLQNSIDQLKQVTCPSEAFVIERLTGLPNVTGVEAVTETNDPNGKLNKAGGYTASVYFSSDLVDSSDLWPSDGYTGIVAYGCDGGGCVEVYKTAEEAEARNEYLAGYDSNALLAPGSHEVLGTCVVRTSDKLTASQQQTMAQNIKDSLTRL
jgi:cell division protein FtsB